MIDPIEQAIRSTQKALEQNPDSRWVVGFSGGKDSTALLKVVSAAIPRARRYPKRIDVIYCDTGVENPVLDGYVKTLFRKLRSEFGASAGPFKTTILRAPVENRFFVKLIGRGYPPPTNTFRWCTNNLRIRPVAEFIRRAAEEDAVVALGMRLAESQQRDRSLLRAGGKIWQYQNEGGRRYRLFLPILHLDVSEVWDAVFSLQQPESVDPEKLAILYRGASGECPIVKSPQAPPCASGRFGCWTCTVVRKDRSAQSLVEAGHDELVPFIEFRDWLARIRNDQHRRWSRRRSGADGMGPFTLLARREILRKLRLLEKRTGVSVLPNSEFQEIQKLWAADKHLDRLHRPPTAARSAT